MSNMEDFFKKLGKIVSSSSIMVAQKHIGRHYSFSDEVLKNALSQNMNLT